MRKLHGLHPTLRQLMIVVAFSAVLSAAVALVVRDELPGVRGVIIAMGFLPSPLVLAWMLRRLDRPGPIREWACSILGLMPFLIFAAWWSWLMTGRHLPTPMRMPPTYVSITVVAAFLVVFANGVIELIPVRCPTCLRFTSIPTGRRRERTRWCASCDGRFRERSDGTWGLEAEGDSA